MIALTEPVEAGDTLTLKVRVVEDGGSHVNVAVVDKGLTQRFWVAREGLGRPIMNGQGA